MTKSKFPQFYAYVKVKRENDFGWFTIESNHEFMFMYRLMRMLVKAKKIMKKGFFEYYGNIPESLFDRLIVEDYANVEFIEWNKYLTLKNNGVGECRIE